jgi:hypothetical protein
LGRESNEYLESTKRYNEMKQTAVQWLASNVMYLNITPNEMHEFLEWYEEAKDMERNQLIDAHISGYEYHAQSEKFVAGYNYFEKTYEEPYEKP